jgi:hypothetical protein
VVSLFNNLTRIAKLLHPVVAPFSAAGLDYARDVVNHAGESLLRYTSVNVRAILGNLSSEQSR